MRRGGLHALFFLSGASALIYELVWQRLLFLVFGVSTLSVSAVLAAFMGGLALGGFLLGRWADRTARPLRLYAILELGIAATGLLVAPAFVLVAQVWTALYGVLAPGPWTGACLRFGLGLLVLAAPATLMGGTLPVMARLALQRTNGLPSTFSLLYAVNTLGGVLGAVLTGFVLLPFAGMRVALLVAAGVNVFVGLCAALAALLAREEPAADGPMALENESAPLPALICAGVTGAVALGLEVAWTRVLGILTSNSAYGFALLLAVMLLGLALGSVIQCRWSRRGGDSWRRLALCQWLLAAVTLASLPAFRAAPDWLMRCSDGSSTIALFLGELALTAAALLAPAVLMGMSLPLLAAAVLSDPRRFGHGVGRLYAVNTLGCVVGAAATGLLLIPGLGIQATFGILTATTLGVGVLSWWRSSIPWGFARLIPIGVLAVFGAAWLLLPPGVFLKSRVAAPRQLLYYREGNCATVSVVAEPNGTRSIHVDGQPVAGTSASSVIDQKMLAHLPLLLHPAPRRALTVGFGSGGTSHSMTLHGIAVDCVEIEAAVPAAGALFVSENHDVRARPGYRLILDDARSWLRVAPVRYDVIATDCTNIQYRSNGDLYTVDYFRLMRDRLAPGGLAAAWVPANGIDGADLKTLLRSFRSVLPHTSVWYMSTLPTDFLIVVGTPDVLAIDLERLRARMEQPDVAHDLDAAGLADPYRLVYTLLGAEEDLMPYIGPGPLNTDDRPVLSYATYGAGFRSTIAGNLLRLLTCRPDAARFVTHPAAGEVMLRHYVASNELLLGHVAHLAGAEPVAQQHYENAARLVPTDTSLLMPVRHIAAGDTSDP